MVARELQVSYRKRNDLPRFDARQSLGQPSLAAAMVRDIIEHEAVEVFIAVMLTIKFRPICFYEVGRGTLTTVLAEPREVFKAAILANAGCVIVAHNHPSGEPEPSPEDLAITRRLEAAGTLLQVHLADHIVIGSHSRYFSFRESGLLSGI